MSDLVEVDDAASDTVPQRSRRRSVTAQRWSRWLHVYTSMISLAVVLFFGITGLTLNHPTWTFGSSPHTDRYEGTLPAGFDADGTVDFLAVSEFVRTNHGVHGHVTDYTADDTSGSISFRAAGYGADIVFQIPSGTYVLTVEQQGFLAVMNDLHKGRDTPGGWNWVIDISAIFLVVVSLTGLSIQIFYRKRRRRALIIVGALTAITIVAVIVSTR